MALITGDGTPITFDGFGTPDRIVIDAGPDDLPRWHARRAKKGTPPKAHLPTKNKWHTVNTFGKIVPTGLKAKTEDVLRTLCFMQGLEGTKDAPVIRRGVWRITVTGYAWRHKQLACGSLVPDLDADAVLVPLRDSLQGANIIDDDGRIIEAIGYAVHRKGKPGFRVVLERLDVGTTSRRAGT